MNDLQAAVRQAWRKMAPSATWRGMDTGWHALDLHTLGALVHRSKPAVVLMAGGLGAGGLGVFVGDLLDHNLRGKVVAGEVMGPERRRSLPEHRRVQWIASDLLVDDFRTAQRLTHDGSPVLVVACPSSTFVIEWQEVAGLVTVGSYLVLHGESTDALTAGPTFIPDLALDPAGLSACAWLLRVPR